MKKIILSYIMGLITMLIVGVSAVYLYNAKDIEYKDSNVQDAIDDLYNKYNKHSISFDLDGGTINTTNKIVNYGDTIGTLPVPVKDNFEFVGWYYNDELVDENTKYSFDSDITLTAKYEQKKFKLIIGHSCGDYTYTYPLLQYIITADGYTIYTKYQENYNRFLYLSPGTKVTLQIANGSNVNFYKTGSWNSSEFIKSTNIISFNMPAQNAYFYHSDSYGAQNQAMYLADENLENLLPVSITYGS